ncbi:respiratory chain complex I subunit 1 family protein [Lacibacterium aquatile]|uniref:Respiratory chain complex I subunit 1 family protein n=1 Tax=Lacibacterium aquatile TaxID=1168082 RepID=A0ABW5DMZ6_9PROT
MSGILIQALQAILILAIAPLLTGIVKTVRARAAGRRGPSPLQPYRDLRKLWLKESLLIEGASPFHAKAPLLILVSMALAAALLPSASRDLITIGIADLLVVIGLLALGRAMQVLAALESRTAFSGQGVGRELLTAVAAEPVLLVGLMGVVQVAGTSDLAGASSSLAAAGVNVSLALALVALILAALAEAGRMPFDNPSTHLELTMVHEAMVLDYAGRELACIEAAKSLRLTVLLALLAALFLPFGTAASGDWLGALIGVPLWIAKMIGLTLALGIGEATVAKLRVFRVPELLALGLLCGLLAVVFLLLGGRV